MINLLTGLSLALLATPIETPASSYVTRVSCLYGSGTGFQIKNGLIVTAAHVVANPAAPLQKCYAFNQPVTVVFKDTSLDYAILAPEYGAALTGGLDIDCSGFKHGQRVTSIGWPGWVFTKKDHIATRLLDEPWSSPTSWKGQKILLGKDVVIPGMSGGPVIDRKTGYAVGITTGRYLSYTGRYSISRELKDTFLCK